MSYILHDCDSLITLYDNNKANLNISYSQIYTINMRNLFSFCYSLKSLPDISKWNTSKVNNISHLFSNCKSLKSLPDISKWDTSNVKDMRKMFYNCISIITLPDISKWKTSNTDNIYGMFLGCESLITLPDISKWNISKVKYMDEIFSNCKSLKSLPDISKWDTKNVENMSYLFNECNSLESLPDISKWKTSNVKDMNGMFSNCNSLESLPDIYKWDITNINLIRDMLSGCKSTLKLLTKSFSLKKYIDNIIFELTYEKKLDNEFNVNILGSMFLYNNKDNGTIIYNNKIYELVKYIEDIDKNYNHKDKFKILLFLDKNIDDISYIFFHCDSLISVKYSEIINYSNEIKEENNNYSYDSEINQTIINKMILYIILIKFM